MQENISANRMYEESRNGKFSKIVQRIKIASQEGRVDICECKIDIPQYIVEQLARLGYHFHYYKGRADPGHEAQTMCIICWEVNCQKEDSNPSLFCKLLRLRH